RGRRGVYEVEDSSHYCLVDPGTRLPARDSHQVRSGYATRKHSSHSTFPFAFTRVQDERRRSNSREVGLGRKSSDRIARGEPVGGRGGGSSQPGGHLSGT